MARKFFVLGILVMASALGVVGYQVLTFYFYGGWPTVSVHSLYQDAFGSYPALEWGWGNELLQGFGRLPVAAVGIVLCYVLLLLSDAMRRRGTRHSR